MFGGKKLHEWPPLEAEIWEWELDSRGTPVKLCFSLLGRTGRSGYMVGWEVAAFCSRPLKLQCLFEVYAVGKKKGFKESILNSYGARDCLEALYKQLKRDLHIQEAPQT